MITRFYKILYKNKDVVYVGVTTRTINARFKEHIELKNLNPEFYSVVEFDKIEHPDICSLEDFYREREKVAALEQKYIEEELNRGSHLLNLSSGGEWGSQILNKLKKENFFKQFGTYAGYTKYKKLKEKVPKWFYHWVGHRMENKVQVWLRNWSYHQTENSVKVWLTSWVSSKTNNETKIWLKSWAHHTRGNKVKRWLCHWTKNKSENDVKVWLKCWLLV